jgi:hypothetical protein
MRKNRPEQMFSAVHLADIAGFACAVQQASVMPRCRVHGLANLEPQRQGGSLAWW